VSNYSVFEVWEGEKKSEAGAILPKQTTLNGNGLVGVSNQKL